MLCLRILFIVVDLNEEDEGQVETDIVVEVPVEVPVL